MLLKEMHSNQKLTENLENVVSVISRIRSIELTCEDPEELEDEILTIRGQLIEVLNSVRDNHLTVIRGPPGTGKTYHLAIAI